jgi:hypothetical protein
MASRRLQRTQCFPTTEHPDEGWHPHQPASAARWSPGKGMWPVEMANSGCQPSLWTTQESTVAILPNFNRRQLLTSAATITVAGIAPDIPHAELAKLGTPQPTQVSSPSPAQTQACNFGRVTVLRFRQIAERNRIRREAGLPLLSVSKELRRMKEVADTERFREFADAHRKTVYIKMLARMRRRCGVPNWAPTGMLSGGGMCFAAQVEKQIRKLYRRIGVIGCSVAIRWIESSKDRSIPA